LGEKVKIKYEKYSKLKYDLLKSLIDAKNVESDREISCPLCRDYFLLAVNKRVYHRQQSFLCTCEGARNSDYHRKPSILVGLEKQQVKCIHCQKLIIVFDETTLRTVFDGDRIMLVVCDGCKSELDRVNLTAQLAELEKEVEADKSYSRNPPKRRSFRMPEPLPEPKPKTVSKPVPKLSAEEMIRRMNMKPGGTKHE